MLGKPSRRLRKHLEKKGRIATATVLEVSGGNLKIGAGDRIGEREAVVELTLRIAPDDQQPFDVTEKFRVHENEIPDRNDEIGVIYDPGDHDKVMLETGPGGAGSPQNLPPESAMQEAQAWLDAFGDGAQGPRADPVDRLEGLAKMRESGEITEAEFEAQKAKLLEEG